MPRACYEATYGTRRRMTLTLCHMDCQWPSLGLRMHKHIVASQLKRTIMGCVCFFCFVDKPLSIVSLVGVVLQLASVLEHLDHIMTDVSG